MPFHKLPIEFKADNKAHVAELHQALTKLNLLPKPDQPTPASKVIDESIKVAVREFNKESTIGTTAKIDTKTIENLNVALHDKFISSSKSRIDNLHQMLEKVNIKVEKRRAD